MASKKAQLSQLENRMSQPGFWDNQDAAQRVTSQLSALKAVVEPVEELQKEVQDLLELYELAADESDEDELAQLADNVGIFHDI